VKDPKTNPDDYNGLLFPGGSETALAECITRLVTGQVAIPSPREIHERSTLQSYPAHVREVEGIYHEVMDRKLGPLGTQVTIRPGLSASLKRASVPPVAAS
jgi:hypothetical protein